MVTPDSKSQKLKMSLNTKGFTTQQVQRLLTLKDLRDPGFVEDELYSPDALTDLRYRLEVIKLFDSKYGAVELS